MIQKMRIWLERAANSRTLLMGSAAIVVGLASGAGVWLFKLAIDILQKLMFGNLNNFFSHAGSWTVILIPVIGGVIVGLIIQYLLGDEKVHGTAAVMESVALTGGRLRYQQTPLKSIAAVISIGAGASVGPEDPSVQIGANLGSMIAQWLHLADDRIRTLVAAGAGSAIAAAFNAPIAGVFFALEIILGEIGSDSLGLILVAAVTSSVFTQAVSGSTPAFAVPQYSFHSIWELPLYLVLGLLAGPISAFYSRLFYSIQDFYHNWKIPRWVKPVSAGLAVGVVGFFLPRAFGVGYDTIGEILNQNDLGLWLLLALLIAKTVLTPISIGGGFLGGVFAPALYIGATLGGAFGMVAARLFPGLGINPSAFALVGMAAVLAGAVHAPLTAVILLFELTSDYHIILPLMFAVAVTMILSQRIQKDSVYDLGLARSGIRLDRGRDVEMMQAITVGEAMHPDTSVLLESMNLEEGAETLMHQHHHGLPVVDDKGWLTGIVTVQDIEHAEEGQHIVADVMTRKVETAYPDETLNMALRRMSHRDIGRLPVVARDNPHKLLGVLRRADVIHAYDIALTRRTAQRHREQTVRLDALTPSRVDVSNVTIEENALCAGKKMSEIPFPRDSVIASVRRGQKIFIPRGDTELRAGDILVVVAEGDALNGVSRLCRAPE
ncbi:MAG TPA: chloride channel protein [Anaerolineales bacterium]|nr:chloride channel protein [Anaerolineales bacterium]